MRYLGNKTKLIPFILDAIAELGIEPGSVCDPFAGTASVARALKDAGWQAHAGDVMASSYALQVARVELDAAPGFPADLLAGDGSGDGGEPGEIAYRELLGELRDLPPVPGFITEHYTPAGEEGARHGRMYFTPENAGRIDAVRRRIARWREAGRIGRRREQLLIATLIEAADRVANTTGVYASFVKSWQPNALRELELRPLRPVPRRKGVGPSSAYLGRARRLVARVGPVDLLYLDPPYNERQYPAYYHLPELIAQGWDPAPELRGKTGLIPDADRRSDWCRRGECSAALRRLLDRADAAHILLSYNDEGLLEAAEIEARLRERGRADTYRRFGRGYRRYRSDGDGPDREYSRDRVREHLHYVRAG